MPFLRFSGFQNRFLQNIAPQLIEEFSRLVHIPQEKVKIELAAIEAITNSPRSVEILMFPRAQEIHDAIASKMNALLQQFGYENVHIYFVMLAPTLYYMEGRPLQSVSTEMGV
ncbi:DUF1904 family protein [Paenibacillus sp. y28]|uniref:DUF1904 family protein n=1 Tax=Paenibacillus sp. y28 TaxID=3129110 RepID=UPI0030177529